MDQNQPKSPLPFLAALLVGGGLLFLGISKKQNPVEKENEIPSSIDYDDENLKEALLASEEEDE